MWSPSVLILLRMFWWAFTLKCYSGHGGKCIEGTSKHLLLTWSKFEELVKNKQCTANTCRQYSERHTTQDRKYTPLETRTNPASFYGWASGGASGGLKNTALTNAAVQSWISDCFESSSRQIRNGFSVVSLSLVGLRQRCYSKLRRKTALCQGIVKTNVQK